MADHDATPSRRWTAARLALRGLGYHARLNLAVALGVIAGTAVLTGALVVGDSVRASLRGLALDGLAGVDSILIQDRFFSERLTIHDPAWRTTPAIMLRVAITHPDSGQRATGVQVLGLDPPDSEASDPAGVPPLAADEVALNESLALALGASVGDDVILRLPTPSEVPRDSPLGRKTDTLANRRLRVAAIRPAQGFFRFSMHPNQQTPLNAIVSRRTLQGALNQAERVNLLLVKPSADQAAPPDHAALASERFADQLSLSDFGLFLKESPKGYWLAGSERMLLEDPAEEALTAALASTPEAVAQPVLTYLANDLTPVAGDTARIAYSTVTALDPVASAPLGPFRLTDGRVLQRIGADEVILNRWTADDLAAQGNSLRVGDQVKFVYFEPESTHGQVRERDVTLRLAGIVELDGAANDRDFTPELKGVTDEESIANWNPPFPYEPKRVRSTPPNDQDEQYWNRYRATPKAFVALETGRRLWESRFGRTTAIRIAPPAHVDRAAFEARWLKELRSRAAALGFAFRPVRAQALSAATGTTPFNLLFFGFSMFIIAAALMLVALLFRLSVERRATEVGILLAVGWTAREVAALLLREAAAIALVAGLVGVGVGVAYAGLMITGLKTWWVAAISTPFLEQSTEPLSLAIGYASGVIVSLGVILFSLRRLRELRVRRLLSGEAFPESSGSSGVPAWRRYLPLAALVGAIGASLAGVNLSGDAQAGAFFGAGAMVLTAALGWWSLWLRVDAFRSVSMTRRAPLMHLALRNAARNSTRSALTIGLVASASFLLIAISAFHLEPPASADRRNSGTGGFALLAEMSSPVYLDLASEDGRFDLGFSDADETLLSRAKIIPFRAQPGDDASCLNLYQPQQPRVLGATAPMIERGGFEWASTAAQTPEDRANPWRLLERPPTRDEQGPLVPVVIDAATAMFSLHLSGVGARYELPQPGAPPLRFEVVGLLKNSVLQGRLIVSETQFLQLFPETGGFAFYLLEAPADDRARVTTALEKTLDGYGCDVESTTARLAEYLAVQNTYLSTFQALGGLGLLLGTFGLGVVQLRNVLERRGELALLRAVGFSMRRLAALVLWENAALLFGGLATGIVAAGVAILPHLINGGAAIPWSSLSGMLGTITVVGLSVGLVTVRSVLRMPLVASLRGE